MVNLDDTRRCPVGPECESCGRLDELAVVTGDTPAGVLCMTVCDACELIAVAPVLSPAEETARVLEHREHVGVNVAPSGEEWPCLTSPSGSAPASRWSPRS
jgi:hypothetical protein